MIHAAALGIALLLAVPWCSAEAQQPAKIYRIGFLGDSLLEQLMDEFRQGMRDHGWMEGRNFVLERRLADQRAGLYAESAARLVRLNVDVIVATSPPWIWAARDATKTIPIVMVFGPDPVQTGLVASLARPGGNITGLTSLSMDLAGKHLELLKEVVPGATRVAVLSNPTNPWHGVAVKNVEARAAALGIRAHSLGVSAAEQIDAAFASMVAHRADALLVLPDPMLVNQRARVADLALKHRLPTMCALREMVEAGCLASYWPSSAAMFRWAADYVHRILSGARPGNLPIEQPTQYELVVNARTAKALRLTIPQSVLLRADQVID